MPQEHTKGSGQMHLAGAASLAVDFLDDFPILESVKEARALVDYRKEETLARFAFGNPMVDSQSICGDDETGQIQKCRINIAPVMK